jgi:hypothetical protein
MCPQMQTAYRCTVPHRREASRAQRVGGMRHSSIKSRDNATAVYVVLAKIAAFGMIVHIIPWIRSRSHQKQHRP